MSTEQKSQVLASIRFLTGPLTNSTFDITTSITKFGRDRSNDIIISDQSVSRFHARLLYANDLWKIENLSETNAITVDQQEVEQAALFPNSIVELGKTVSFIFALLNVQSGRGNALPFTGVVSASLYDCRLRYWRRILLEKKRYTGSRKKIGRVKKHLFWA